MRPLLNSSSGGRVRPNSASALAALTLDRVCQNSLFGQNLGQGYVKDIDSLPEDPLAISSRHGSQLSLYLYGPAAAPFSD